MAKGSRAVAVANQLLADRHKYCIVGDPCRECLNYEDAVEVIKKQYSEVEHLRSGYQQIIPVLENPNRDDREWVLYACREILEGRVPRFGA